MRCPPSLVPPSITCLSSCRCRRLSSLLQNTCEGRAAVCSCVCVCVCVCVCARVRLGVEMVAWCPLLCVIGAWRRASVRHAGLALFLLNPDTPHICVYHPSPPPVQIPMCTPPPPRLIPPRSHPVARIETRIGREPWECCWWR